MTFYTTYIAIIYTYIIINNATITLLLYNNIIIVSLKEKFVSKGLT